jgi:hypothetical protein
MKRTKDDDNMIRRFLLEETEGEEEPTAAEAAAEEAEEESEEEEGSEESAEDNEEVRSSVVDSEIEAVLIDFESTARKEKSDEVKAENKVYKRGLKFLFEQEEYEDQIDLQMFSSELARLIKNYDNLLDMEAIIMKKASDFIEKKYGEVAVDAMKQELSDKHDIDLEDNQDKIDSLSDVPNAVGAASGAAVGE